MILEIGAVLAAADAACKGLNAAAGAVDDIQKLTGLFHGIGQAEHDLQKIRNDGVNEADALRIVMQQEAVKQAKADLQQMFYSINRPDLWEQMQRVQADARKTRQAALKQMQIRRKQQIKELQFVGIVLLAALILVPAAVGFLLWALTR